MIQTVGSRTGVRGGGEEEEEAEREEEERESERERESGDKRVWVGQ